MTGRRQRVPTRILVAAALTVAVLGAVGLSRIFDDDTGPSATSATSSTALAVSTTSSKPASTTSSPAPTVRLNPAWPSKGTSRYSEAETTSPSTTAPR